MIPRFFHVSRIHFETTKEHRILGKFQTTPSEKESCFTEKLQIVENIGNKRENRKEHTAFFLAKGKKLVTHNTTYVY